MQKITIVNFSILLFEVYKTRIFNTHDKRLKAVQPVLTASLPVLGEDSFWKPRLVDAQSCERLSLGPRHVLVRWRLGGGSRVVLPSMVPADAV